jgi:hypothetical protein
VAILAIKIRYANLKIIFKSNNATIKKIIRPRINLCRCFIGHSLKLPLEILYNARVPMKNIVHIRNSKK